MTEPPHEDDSGHDPRAGDALRARRPGPSPEFGAQLAERLHELRWGPSRPAHLWVLVTAWVSAGLLLLVLAAIGAAGSGPFA